MIEVEGGIDSSGLDPVCENEVIPRIPEELYLARGRLPQEEMACDERVGWAASGAEIYTPKFIAVQMGGVNGIVQHGQQDLVVIGVERRARGKALDDETACEGIHGAEHSC